jgi:hypothetical protein
MELLRWVASAGADDPIQVHCAPVVRDAPAGASTQRVKM